MPSNHSHVKDQISRHCLFKVEQMTGQNIEKYQQKELNLRCIQTDKKTRSYIFSLPCDKSREN